MQQANDHLRQMWSHMDLSVLSDVIISYKFVLGVMILGYVLHWLPTRLKAWGRDWFIASPVYLKVGFAAILIFIIYQSWSAELQPFIYFQF
jgi:hypothetical protein